jgi:adenine deaminase
MSKNRHRLIDVARGIKPADVVFSNADIFNPFSCEWEHGTLAVANGIVVGIGKYRGLIEHDLKGKRIVPGLIDAHVHIESSLLIPKEYARVVSSHGTTTVIADPHEIANVSGVAGINFMLRESKGSPIDIFFMLPSCVPATPKDVGGAVLSVTDLAQFVGHPKVLGIGEVMNVPGVLAQDPDLTKKIKLSPLVDGHAPRLTGLDLDAYVLSGMQSDHECTRLEEAKEKLQRGMYIFLREGSTERNIQDLVGIVTPVTASRCCFATDDCHVDMLVHEGHIDNCIRKAISYGLELELTIRIATLSAAERFRLNDRGALSPGRFADFCVLDNSTSFTVKKTFQRGILIQKIPHVKSKCRSHSFVCKTPNVDAIKILGNGYAHVIGIVDQQILTKSMNIPIDSKEIPDFNRDILKVVVCNRYKNRSCGVGLVHGFGLKRGAIAISISHDAHNIVTVGTTDQEILQAIDTVIQNQGALVVIDGDKKILLPLKCAGLMSNLPFQDVVNRLERVKKSLAQMGAIKDPFMYLSFLALTVIPNLRITDRGVFDVEQFRDVPLFFD